MTRERLLIAAVAALLVAVVATLGVLGQGSPSDVAAGLIAVLVLALVADGRLAQRRLAEQMRRTARRDAEQAAAVRKTLAALRQRADRSWQAAWWARKHSHYVRERVDGLDQRTARMEEVLDEVRATPGYPYKERITDWHQVESLQNLYALLPPRQAVPGLRGWAASPDLLLWIVSHMLEHRSKMVVECGSGASTLWMAYALERLGGGQVVALEHDERYAARTRALLKRHGLSEYADVRLAPITPVRIADRDWPWYDTSNLTEVDPVELLVVDGPPSTTGPLARYPAAPLLAERLTPEAVIVLDDAIRREERQIGRMWSEELHLDVEHLRDLEKEALILRRRTAT